MATEIDLGIDGLSDVVQIGHGGSGGSFGRRQFELDRTVAVKVLNSAWDEDVRRRFPANVGRWAGSLIILESLGSIKPGPPKPVSHT